MHHLTARLVSDERGLSKLETLGLLALIATLLAMIPLVRDVVLDVVGFFYNQTDPATGERTDFSTLILGITIAVGAVLVFVGSVYLVLWTDLGTRLAFLVVGAALTGWMTINGVLFVVFAPRGVRPENLEGLSAVQQKIPAIAMTVGSLVLFVMFLVALDRYEKEEEPA